MYIALNGNAKQTAAEKHAFPLAYPGRIPPACSESQARNAPEFFPEFSFLRSFHVEHRP